MIIVSWKYLERSLFFCFLVWPDCDIIIGWFCRNDTIKRMEVKLIPSLEEIPVY